MLWFELILSQGYIEGASGNLLVLDDNYYNQVRYKTLLRMNEDDRIDHLQEVLFDINVNMHVQKADSMNAQIKRIESLGGLETAQQEFEARNGKYAKMDFLQKFKGIGEKQARKIGMDIFHQDFQNTIVVDYHIESITEQLGLEFDSYEKHEEFYTSIADRLDITGWELDRILNEYTDQVTADIRRSMIARRSELTGENIR